MKAKSYINKVIMTIFSIFLFVGLLLVIAILLYSPPKPTLTSNDSMQSTDSNKQGESSGGGGSYFPSQDLCVTCCSDKDYQSYSSIPIRVEDYATHETISNTILCNCENNIIGLDGMYRQDLDGNGIFDIKYSASEIINETSAKMHLQLIREVPI